MLEAGEISVDAFFLRGAGMRSMRQGAKSRGWWAGFVLGMIAFGIFTRVAHTGFVLWDKYLGDGLYAAMVYGIWRMWARTGAAAGGATATMAALEAFQLTLIPARMLGSESWGVRMAGRLMGVQFSWLDLVAYAAGIGCIYVAERDWGHSTRAK